jgi:hypothetical protein
MDYEFCRKGGIFFSLYRRVRMGKWWDMDSNKIDLDSTNIALVQIE